ncbi:Uma2 family endonuclease [Fodinicola feengrottensis]
MGVDDFDPLVDLAGMWTNDLAQLYLPIDGMLATRYEAVDGKLVMSPYEGSGNSWASKRLARQLDDMAEAAGFALYMTLNVVFAAHSWIQPDLVLLRDTLELDTWVSADEVVMPIELVSPSSRRRDRIDKPALMAKAGIPFYLRIEVTKSLPAVSAELCELRDGLYHPIERSTGGRRLDSDVPFPMSVDLLDLLEPRRRQKLV